MIINSNPINLFLFFISSFFFLGWGGSENAKTCL